MILSDKDTNTGSSRYRTSKAIKKVVGKGQLGDDRQADDNRPL